MLSFTKQIREYKKTYISAHLCKTNTGKIKPETKGICYLLGECGKLVEIIWNWERAGRGEEEKTLL